MIGKKKSGFQITSVTSEYEGSTGGEGLREPLGGEAEAVVNGGPAVGPSADPELPGKDGRTKPPPATAGQGAAGGEVPKETGTAAAGTLPGTRSPPPPAPSPCGSRFRVVKLDHGLGEPYRRGRWTCVDLYMDRELDAHGLAKALAGSRHVNSLDSHPELGALLAHRAVSQLRPRPHAPKSQGSPLGESLPAPLGTDPLQVLLQAARTLSLDSPPAPQEKGDPAATPHPANQSHGAKAGARETTSPPTNVKQPSSGDQGGLRKWFQQQHGRHRQQDRTGHGLGEEPPDVRRARRGGGAEGADQGADRSQQPAGAGEHPVKVTGQAGAALPAPVSAPEYSQHRHWVIGLLTPHQHCLRWGGRGGTAQLSAQYWARGGGEGRGVVLFLTPSSPPLPTPTPSKKHYALEHVKLSGRGGRIMC
ncbi:TSC22 domain family protein 4-like isoform X1 [Hemiscyllium ocellatum]|uniref:TSC22 domain family protein 4-like isoform X1 n=1 Tax=Hemiscyllium ocellatum TaxID=170820 RepID=UPI0029676852|nr:TSC22 domain family protein 4-like isoform X1 [Hemiscyllium ocellatum]